jgi:hypothetical protein
MKPTVLHTEGQRGARLKFALVEQRHRIKRTAAYYLVRRHESDRGPNENRPLRHHNR